MNELLTIDCSNCANHEGLDFNAVGYTWTGYILVNDQRLAFKTRGENDASFNEGEKSTLDRVQDAIIKALNLPESFGESNDDGDQNFTEAIMEEIDSEKIIRYYGTPFDPEKDSVNDVWFCNFLTTRKVNSKYDDKVIIDTVLTIPEWEELSSTLEQIIEDLADDPDSVDNLALLKSALEKLQG